MSKILVLLLVNLAIIYVFYVCGVIAGGSFNIFDWSEGCRAAISLGYGTISTMASAIIGIEYKPK